MLYIQALELVSKEVAINWLEHLSMLYIQSWLAKKFKLAGLAG